jgi:hypothetical protein
MTKSTSAPEEGDHFQGKSVEEHLHTARHQHDLVENAHGEQAPSLLFAALETARDVSMVLLLFWTTLNGLELSGQRIGWTLAIFATAFLLWRVGRISLLSWSRLERLHRVMSQEKWEIEHYRSQEREELRVLYTAKGFEGKLLEDIVDVLMADEDRLLRVMLEEEMGLSLGSYEHPLKLALMALGGGFVSVAIFGSFTQIIPHYGALIGCLLTLAITGFTSALVEKNQRISSVVWNLSLGALCYSTLYFLLQLVTPLLK